MRYRFYIDFNADEDYSDREIYYLTSDLEDYMKNHELCYFAKNISVKFQDEYCIKDEKRKIIAGKKALEETGYWIDTDTFDNNLIHIYECSKCHKTVADDYINLHKYCLHCGNPKDVK